MKSYTVKVKGKKFQGLTATVMATSVGEAIDLARVDFVAAFPELVTKNWNLHGFEGDAVVVKPAGTGSWS